MFSFPWSTAKSTIGSTVSNGTVVYGGRLTALRYPELELVDVPALATYVEPVRALTRPENEATAQQLADDVLDYALATLRTDAPLFAAIDDLKWRGPRWTRVHAV